MSRNGTPADNAQLECFHDSLKCETFDLNNELNNSNDVVIDIAEITLKTIIMLEFNKN